MASLSKGKNAVGYKTFDSNPVKTPTKHPEQAASWISKLFLSWCYPMMKLGNQRQLCPDDAWDLTSINSCKVSTDKLTEKWDGKVSIVRTLAQIYGLVYMGIGFLLLGAYGCDFFGPIVLQNVVHLVGAETLNVRSIIIWLSLLGLSRVLKSILFAHFYFQCQMVMLRVTTAMKGFVYQKAMRMSAKSRAQKNTGDIVNIYTTDVNNIIQAAFSVHYLWVLPIMITGVLVKLYSVVGNATFVGVGTILVTLFFNKLIASLQVKYFAKIMKIKDERMKCINEIFGAIQIVKFNSWEKKFRQKVDTIRIRELEVIWKYLRINAYNIFLLWGAPVFVSTATFATYALAMGHDLTASTVFTAIALFRLLQEPLRSLPQCITSCIQAGVSIQRLKEFSDLEDRDVSNVIGKENVVLAKEYSEKDIVVDIKDGEFTWDRDGGSLFDNLNFSAKRGELVVVHGKVASGKSSLCSVLIGDMIKLKGHVFVGGKIAYCPQQSWIQNLTIRDNILFGNPWDAQKYGRVIDACGLKKDFELFAAGDKTEIGEKGLNLSGGQKARISLARACYSDADIFLFDSPLAAVDAIVQNEIFNKCLLGLLRNKTRILISHNPDIIGSKHVDRSIELTGGFIENVPNLQKVDYDAPLVSPLPCHLVKMKEEPCKEEVYVDTSADIAMEGFTPLTKRQSSFMEAIGGSGADGQLVDEEERQEGNVSAHVYLAYFRAIGGIGICIFLVIVQILWQLLQVASDFWLGHWTSETLEEQKKNTTLNMCVYVGLALGSAFMVLVRTLTVSYSGIRGAREMFDKMTTSLLKAPMSFYDANPLGRQLNRYSDDVSCVDFRLPFIFGTMLATVFSVGGSLLTAGIVMRWMGLMIIPLLYIYIQVGFFYLKAARELQRILKVTQSPLLAHVSESLDGVHVVRAFGKSQVDRFIQRNEYVVDKNNSVQFVSMASAEWYAMRVQLMGGVILLLITSTLVSMRNIISPGTVGLVFNYALAIDHGLETFIQAWSYLEMNMISPERIQEYIDIPSEANHENELTKPSNSWPYAGKVRFDKVSFRYKEGGNLVLREISFDLFPGEKIGIVGRTGAGKSSLTMALFRINEIANGRIEIDDVDVSTLGLADLRGRLTIITQAPVLFKGTIRTYLDPFEEYQDEELWSALKKVEMADSISVLEGKLNGIMEENGSNFSVGERQLLCMARALLSRSKVVIMDEATASIDHKTDMILQTVIRSEFQDSTVITIAHRLDTVLDADRIMVLDAGKIVEFDSPKSLIDRGEGHFFDLAKEGGYLDRMLK